jgi:hypothetical protein
MNNNGNTVTHDPVCGVLSQFTFEGCDVPSEYFTDRTPGELNNKPVDVAGRLVSGDARMIVECKDIKRN